MLLSDLALLGLQHYFIGKMAENPIFLDLTLWKDKQLIIRQNNLKKAFWELFSEIGNLTVSEKISASRIPAKGTKLTKGNDLLGFPYHVLDLIRDFNTETGLNIRLLNWFGNGMYLLILFGKNTTLAHSDFFAAAGYAYALTSSPWDYPELILDSQSTNSPDFKTLENATFHQWIKEINLEDSKSLLTNIEFELKKIAHFLGL